MISLFSLNNAVNLSQLKFKLIKDIICRSYGAQIFSLNLLSTEIPAPMAPDRYLCKEVIYNCVRL